MWFRSPFLPLGFLSATFVYAVLSFGAVEILTLDICVAALTGISLLYVLLTRRTNWSPAMDGTLFAFMVAAPAYVAFQLIPLPISWIAVLSPAKAELTTGLIRLGFSIPVTALAVDPAATLSYFCRVLAYLIIFLLVRQLLWRMAGDPWFVVFPLLGIGVGEALEGLLQCHYAAAACEFVTGSYINRNHFAGLLEICFPFVLLYLLLLISRARKTRAAPIIEVMKIGVLLLGVVIIVGAVFASLSRTGVTIILLCLSGISLVYIYASLPFRWRVAGLLSFAGLMIVVSFTASPWALVHRFGELSNLQTAAMDRRIIWRQTISLIKDYPLFGCGLGGYASAYLKYKTGMPLWGTSFVHNDYLQAMAELGLIGSLIVGGLILRLLIPAIRIAAVLPASLEIKMLVIACVSAMLSMLLHGLVDFNFYIPANAMGFAWICGVASAIPYLYDNSRQSPSVEQHASRGIQLSACPKR